LIKNKKSEFDEIFQIKVRLIRIGFLIGIVIAIEKYKAGSGKN